MCDLIDFARVKRDEVFDTKVFCRHVKGLDQKH